MRILIDPNALDIGSRGRGWLATSKIFHPALPTLCFVSIRFLTDPSVGDDAVRRLRVPVEFSYLSPRVLPPPTEKRECCPSECALTLSFHILEIFCFLPIGNFVLYIEYL